jgi:hypothetical protein
MVDFYTKNTEIRKQLLIASTALEKAEDIANKKSESFTFNIEYGMGGMFKPKVATYNKNQLLEMIQDGSFQNLSYEQKQASIEVLAGTEDNTGWSDSSNSTGGWSSSSSNC